MMSVAASALGLTHNIPPKTASHPVSNKPLAGGLTHIHAVGPVEHAHPIVQPVMTPAKPVAHPGTGKSIAGTGGVGATHGTIAQQGIAVVSTAHDVLQSAPNSHKGLLVVALIALGGVIVWRMH